MAIYIHQNKDWTAFRWDTAAVEWALKGAHDRLAALIDKVAQLGFEVKENTDAATVSEELIHSFAIEGERLNPKQVRSSVANHLGLENAGVVTDHYVDGAVQMLLDATHNSDKSLNEERIFSWQATLFPTGRSGLYKIELGRWRTGAMQVISGGFGREKVHYEAPEAERLTDEMNAFLHWFNTDAISDGLLKAAIAHFWFVSIHPLSDGNGRIARAISELCLSKTDALPQRFYSMSVQINKDKKNYYEILERTQKGNGNITEWLVWFLECLQRTLDLSLAEIEIVLKKHRFWAEKGSLITNKEQRMLLERLFDGFKGKLTAKKWAKIAKCDTETALADLEALVTKGLLKTIENGNTSYVLNL